MSGINGSADGDLIHKLYDFNQQIHKLYDLKQQVQSEPELNSSSNDDLSKLQSSMESMLTKELEEIENGVQQPIKNEDMVLQLEPIMLNPESENPTYGTAAPPASPPSPYSLIFTEPPTSRDLGEVCSGEFVPSFVVMECTRCYIYVTVSDGDPKCPKCGSYDLLNEFLGNFGLCKRRKN